MQEGNGWMVDHTPARRRRGRISCCLLPIPISRGDVLEAGFWWTASATTDGANGPTRVFLSGLDVEK